MLRTSRFPKFSHATIKNVENLQSLSIPIAQLDKRILSQKVLKFFRETHKLTMKLGHSDIPTKNDSTHHKKFLNFFHPNLHFNIFIFILIRELKHYNEHHWFRSQVY